MSSRDVARDVSIQTGRPVSTPYLGKGTQLLLDQHDGAEVALSLRKIREGFGTGPVVRVRRGSDNVERDIGFDGDLVDTQALEDFANGGDVFVVTWYDQGGNAHDPSQGTQADQPKIVASGSVITESGFPVLDFDGSDDHFEPSAPPSDEITAVAVVARTIQGSSEANILLSWQDSGGNPWLAVGLENFSDSKEQTIITHKNGSTEAFYNAMSAGDKTYEGKPDDNEFALVGGRGQNLDTSDANALNLRIGGNHNDSNYPNQRVAEIILYPSYDDVVALHQSQDKHYALL